MTRLEIPFDDEELRALKALGGADHPDDPVAVVKTIVRERIALEEAREQELKAALRGDFAALDRGEGVPVTRDLFDRLRETVEDVATRGKA